MELRPGYKHTEIGVIPNEWTVGAARDLVCSMKSGLSRRLHVQDIGLPVLTSTNIQDNRLVSDSLKYWYAHDPQGANTADYKLNDGDILLCFINSLAQIGKPCIYRDIGRPVIYTTNIFRIVASENTVPEFAFYLFSLNSFQAALQLIAKPAVNQASFTKHDFLDIPVPLPSSKTEQRAIAAALSDADALIAGLERLIAKKRDIKQAAMQQLLTGQTRLPGFSGEWSRRRLGELAEMGSGGTPPAGNPDYYGGAIPWVAISDMTQAGRFIERTERSLSDSGLANSAAQLFPAGTVLYAMYASLGECSIACMELSTSQAILGIRPRTGLVRDFLYYSLTSRKEFVKTLGQQGTQSNLNKGIVQGFEIHLPPPEEQSAIATVLSDMDADLSAVESRLAKTRAIKQGMMQELLTGRTRLI